MSAHREDIAFAALLLATVLSLALGEWDSARPGLHHTGNAIASHGKIALPLALLTLVKGTLVVREFMHLRQVRWIWQAALMGWLLLVIACIGAASLLGPR